MAKLEQKKEVLFGKIAYRRGFVDKAQLSDALEELARRRRDGQKSHIGEVMIDLQLISKEQSDLILAEQGGLAADRIEGYRIVAKLGEGGMGQVYKAMQLSMDRPVALKVLNKRYANDEVYIKRFLREAKNAGRLHHHNIVAGIDAGQSNGWYYFAMEMVEGESLERHLQKVGILDEYEALHIVLDMARALDHADKLQIVHRDIKPGNILLMPDGTAKLTDLGLAKEAFDLSLTQPGMAVGTPYYISPEQARAEPDVDVRSDLYSLGATLFHMLTGRPPFQANSVDAVLTKHVVEPAPSARTINPHISKLTDRIISKLLMKKPADRFEAPHHLEKEVAGHLKKMDESPFDHFDAAEVAQKVKASDPMAATMDTKIIKTVIESEHTKRAKLKALEKQLPRDSVLFYESDPSEKVYMLVRGHVELLRAGRKDEEIRNSGTYFGDVEVLLGLPRKSTAVCRSQCVVIELEEKQYLTLLQGSPKQGLEVVRKLILEMRELDAQREKLLDDVAGLEYHLREEAGRTAELLTLFDELIHTHERAGRSRKSKKNFHDDLAGWIKSVQTKGYLKD